MTSIDILLYVRTKITKNYIFVIVCRVSCVRILKTHFCIKKRKHTPKILCTRTR